MDRLRQLALIPFGEGVGVRQEVTVAAAEHVVAAHVAVLALEAGVVYTEPLLKLEEFLGLLFSEEVNAAQLAGEDQHLAVGIEDFGIEVGGHQILGKGDGAMVGEDDDGRILDVGADRLSKLLGAGRFILSDGHLAEEDFDFGQDALGDRLMSNGECGRMGRMAVDDAHHFRVVPIGGEVKQDFAGAFLDTTNLLALVVNDAAVVRLHEALADTGRRTKNLPLVQANGDIAIVGGSEALVIKATADFADLFTQLTFAGGHGSLSVSAPTGRDKLAQGNALDSGFVCVVQASTGRDKVGRCRLLSPLWGLLSLRCLLTQGVALGDVLTALWAVLLASCSQMPFIQNARAVCV